MKHSLKLLLIYFFVNNTFGQFKIKGNVNFPSQKYKSEILDKTKQNIYYSYVYSPNTNEKAKTSLTILQIGQNYSKFTDVFLLKNDSLDKQFSLLKKLGIKDLNKVVSIKSKIEFKKSVIKNLSIDSITVQGKILSTKYEYKEKAPILKWQLTNEGKTILDYKVKKAVINYSGRKWIAWYTEEIPINLGPYVFGNLPGLILELYDDKKNFHFTAVGMDNKEEEIYKRIEKKIIKTRKKDFFKAERNFHEKPELFVRATIRGGGNFKKKAYSPIEIID
ncbi:GLPGLI family protein [uncultured Polaribacter sp.]|uniref:GLPGLI family protein n=1 Tax=uncultured Polaribacter sp. TaxID=174711 RepID=UPI002624267C|nr:GLPGLI family protein [uncultured Polaribacter sp.]